MFYIKKTCLGFKGFIRKNLDLPPSSLIKKKRRKLYETVIQGSKRIESFVWKLHIPRVLRKFHMANEPSVPKCCFKIIHSYSENKQRI